MTPPPPDDPLDSDDPVLTPYERAVLLGLWLFAVCLPDLAVWVASDATRPPILTLLTLGITAPFFGRALARVRLIGVLPSEPRSLDHLPPVLARMVREADAIRQELHHHYLEQSLERAWMLTREFAKLPSDLRDGRERSIAAIAAVHALIDLHADPGHVAGSVRRTRLAAALAEFATSLAEPASTGFR